MHVSSLVIETFGDKSKIVHEVKIKYVLNVITFVTVCKSMQFYIYKCIKFHTLQILLELYDQQYESFKIYSISPFCNEWR